MTRFHRFVCQPRNVHLKPEKHRRVGVAFGSLFTREDGLAPVSRGLASVFGNLNNEDFDAAAWCFPMAAQLLAWNDRNRYPGVVLLAKAAV